MNQDHTTAVTQPIAHALDELQSTIRTRYADAQFAVACDVEEPESVHLVTTVDIEEPEDVLDLVMDRLLDLHVQGVPIHVIPLRPLQRVVADEQPSLPHAATLTRSVPYL